jgi:hypothetical protein
VEIAHRLSHPSSPSLFIPILRYSTAKKSESNFHSISIRSAILPLLVIRRDPQHVVAADQDLAQHALVLAVDPLDGAAELNVHVAVDADQAAGVLGLAPLEADAHVGVYERLQHWPRVHGDELCEREGISPESCDELGGVWERRTLIFAVFCVYFCVSLLRSAIRSCSL